MKFSTLFVAITALTMTSTMTARADSEKEFCNLHGDGFKTLAGIAQEQAAQLNTEHLNNLGLQSTPTMENPAIIDVGVLVHEQLIEAYKEPLTKTADGKYYENGAQFLIQRLNAQYAYFNATLKMQNVPVVLRPVNIFPVNFDIPSESNGRSAQLDIEDITQCLIQPKEALEAGKSSKFCSQAKALEMRSRFKDRVDLFHYVREKTNFDKYQGFGGYYTGIHLMDTYRYDTKVVQSRFFDMPEHLENLRFGHEAASVLAHEFGHTFGAMHQVSDAEPVSVGPDADNRAFSCGKRTPLGMVDVGKKHTVMWSFSGGIFNPDHRFFSTPELSVDGEACGAEGEANNLRHVKEHAPLVVNKGSLPDVTSNVTFFIPESRVSRSQGFVTVQLKRTGALENEAYLTLTAKDGSAWEGRDFKLGLQDIKFAKGESQKSIEVELLPREGSHSDETFRLAIHSAIGATFTSESGDITIRSDTAAMAGVLKFETASIQVVEGGTVQARILREHGQDGVITFQLSSTDISATAGTDYAFSTSTYSMAAGQASMEVSIPTLATAGNQGSRSFTVGLSHLTNGAELGTLTTLSVTINDSAAAAPSAPVAPKDSGGSGGSMGGWSVFALLIAIVMRKRA